MNMLIMHRAWQKKLHALVHDGGHKAEIYKYLWLLMTKGDPEVFQKTLQHFKPTGMRRNHGSFPTLRTTMPTELVSVILTVQQKINFLCSFQISGHFATGILNTKMLIQTCWWKGNDIVNLCMLCALYLQ